MRLAAAIAALTIVTVSPLAGLADEGSPGEGRKIAEAQCARCHAVGQGEILSPNDDAPTFGSIANSEHNAQSLRVFLRTPHVTMPSIVLSDRDRDDVTAYIMSMRRSE